MIEKIQLLLRALYQGGELNNITNWKKRTIRANIISVITIVLLFVGIFYGIQLDLTPEEIGVIATLLIGLFNALNSIVLIATTKEIGLRPKGGDTKPSSGGGTVENSGEETPR